EYFTQRSGGRWSALVRIPFASLGVKTPASGTHWTLNIGRESSAPASRNSPRGLESRNNELP
ncbi:MAG: hypothetical protein V8T87_09770, partial [Victivallales bacterium]